MVPQARENARGKGQGRATRLRDAETGVERFVSTENAELNYLRAGDTVTLVVGGIYADVAYTEKRVFYAYDGGIGIRYNRDSVFARKEREMFRHECENFNKTKKQKFENQK